VKYNDDVTKNVTAKSPGE